MLDMEQRLKLPRLLDLGNTPAATRRRGYWRYVHRFRLRSGMPAVLVGL